MVRKHNEFIKYVFYSVISAVIFLLIYSIWFNPQIITNFTNSIKSNMKLSTTSQSDFPCIDALNEFIEIKRQIRTDLNINLVEAKKFINKTEAEKELVKWSSGANLN